MAAKAASPTQQFVPLREVKRGFAVLRDGSLRAILMVSSINFALKSHDEQVAILAQFQSFLNTIDFPIQIYLQSRRLDITPYLELLRTKEPDQENDLMRVQLREYIDFIRSFVSEVDIMAKSFFVVVPYEPPALNVRKDLNNLLSGRGLARENETLSFEEHRSQLEQRIAIVEQGLARVGVRSIVLGDDEIVELFYHLFNPAAEGRAGAEERTPSFRV
jgi:type IV secretory pathway VirB4 component